MRLLLPSIAGILVACMAAPAAAVTIDGVRDAAYGAALNVQTTQTDPFDSAMGVKDAASGSELDEAYGFISGGVLHLFVTGNLQILANPSDPGTFADYLHVFIDSKAGGQHALRSDNGSVGFVNLGSMGGMTFDVGFAPDYWIGLLGIGGPDFGQPYCLTATYAELPAGAAAAGYGLGQVEAGVPGPLNRRDESIRLQLAIDNSNVAGVTQGCAAASGAGVTTGVELAIPLSAIGDPTGCVTVALVTSTKSFLLLNQTLGPLPPGTCAGRPASSVDFSSISGNQFFGLCPSSTPTRRETWGAVKTLYR